MDAFRNYDDDPRSLQARLNFYLTYLADVVPDEVTVLLIPEHLQCYDLNQLARERNSTTPERKEIRLMCDEGIFMTGIVQQGSRAAAAEEIAAYLACTQYRQGFFARFQHQAWGIFTGLQNITFCSSRDGRDWERTTGDLHPIGHVREVVRYFEREYARVRHH